MKKYAFIILNWNGKNHTKQCLGSLESIDYRHEFDIILVDNGSEDGSQEELQELIDSMKRHVSFIKLKENTGFTGGHIEGIKHTNADIVCLLNNDAVVAPNILSEVDTIVKSLGDSFGAIGGRAYFWNKQQKAFDVWNEFFTYQKIDPHTATAYTQKGDPGESLAPKIVDNVSGACVFVNRNAIDTAGYLDDRFFAYYEETDMFARFKRCGFEVYYCPTIRYWHRFEPSEGSHGASSKHIKNFSATLIAKNQFLFAVKNFESRYLLKFLSWYYLRFFVSILKLAYKPHEHTQNLIIIKTTLSNTIVIPRLIRDRREINNRIPQVVGYNTKIVQEAQRKTVVFIDDLIGEVKELVENNIDINDRVHLSISKICTTKTPHRCMNLKVDNQEVYGISAALSRTNSTIVIQDKTVEVSLFKKEIDRINNDKPYRKKHGGLFSFNRAFLYELVRLKLNPGQSTNWNIRLSKKHDHKMRKLFRDLTIRPRNAVKLLQDYLSFRIRTGGYKDVFRALLGIAKNSVLKGSYTIAVIRAGAHEQRLHNLRSTDPEGGGVIKLSGFPVTQIPLFINCRDRVKTLKQTIASLEHAGFKRIYLIDNQSSYSSLLNFYKSCPYQVILLGENMGHKAPWESLAVKLISGGNPYVVTDPDVVLSEGYTIETIKKILELFDMHPGYVKIGAGLEIDNIPDYYEHKKTVQKWEKQFWTKPIAKSNGLIAYDAEIDTTFAMYRPNSGYTTLPSIRLGGKHTAKHLPWYQNSKKPNNEEKYYSEHASSAVNTWNKVSLPDYLQEYIG